MSIICWFNGPSAHNLIHTLPRQDVEVGCNHIEQIRPMDAVCAFDVEVVAQLPRTPNTQYYTRAAAQQPNWNIIVNDIVSGGNSGILACWVAANRFPRDTIYIIGCDWGITDHSQFDHIYQKGATRKYTNNSKKKIARLFNGHQAFVVNDGWPDVPLPIISEKQFLDKIQ